MKALHHCRWDTNSQSLTQLRVHVQHVLEADLMKGGSNNSITGMGIQPLDKPAVSAEKVGTSEMSARPRSSNNILL